MSSKDIPIDDDDRDPHGRPSWLGSADVGAPRNRTTSVGFPPASSSAHRVEAEVRAWVARAVIGLGLCPFAKAADRRGAVVYRVSDAVDPEALLDELRVEMDRLVAAEVAQHETTLLIHPHVLQDFDDYNDFLDVADAAIEKRGLEGVLQVASFHPDYRFAGTSLDDITNATNRSPYPVLQLLREASVEHALAALEDPDTIVDANLATLEALGQAGWNALQAACRDDAVAASAAKDRAC